VRAVEGFPAGRFMVLPMAKPVSRGHWQAALALSVDSGTDGRQQLSDCLFEQDFRSRSEAMDFAVTQGELWASDPEAYLAPRLSP
jgi:hypothetical protein